MPTVASPELIDAALASAIESGAAAGVVAAVASSEGILYESAAGLGGPGGGPIAVDAIFRIASMTKAVTCLAAMQLVERGDLVLDDPLAELLPELAAVEVLTGFDEATGAARFRPPATPVSLRHLLTHTAGFSYDWLNADLARYVRETGLSDDDSGPGVLKGPLIADPGVGWNYGVNTDWVGRAVEVAGRQPLDAWFRDQIFAPLGLRDTGFVVDRQQAVRLATAYIRGNDGGLTPSDHFSAPVEVRYPSAGGGLVSTAHDYATFLRVFLGHGSVEGTRILRPESVATMGAGHIGDILPGPMRSASPAFSHDFDVLGDHPKTFGLGFMVNTAGIPGRRRAGSMAWAGIFNTYYWVDPSANVAGVWLSQSLPFYAPAAVAAFEDFERATYAAIT